MFPVWFDLFNVYLQSPFTASIIFDSFLEDINVTQILTWYESPFKKASCSSLSIEHQKQLGFHISPTKGTLLLLNLFRLIARA